MFCDNTDEHLVCRLRPGSAGANTAADHIEVSTEAIRQLPTRRRRKVLFRADGAGATKEYLRWITAGGGNKANTWEYSVGHTRDEDFWTGPGQGPRDGVDPGAGRQGQAARGRGPGGDHRHARPRGLARRAAGDRAPRAGPPQVRPRPETLRGGHRLPLPGHRLQHPGRQLQWLDARHRVHAHVESGIRRSKALTLTRLPSSKFALNQAWCTLLALAMDLLAWLQLLALDGRLARAEPATLRADLLDIPAHLTDHARRRELKLDPAWPASHAAVKAWDRVQALPDPG